MKMPAIKGDSRYCEFLICASASNLHPTVCARSVLLLHFISFDLFVQFSFHCPSRNFIIKIVENSKMYKDTLNIYKLNNSKR